MMEPEIMNSPNRGLDIEEALNPSSRAPHYSGQKFVVRLRNYLRKEMGREAFPSLLQAFLILWLQARAMPLTAYILMGPLIRREWYFLLPVAFLSVQICSLLPGPLLARYWGRRKLGDMLSLSLPPIGLWPGLLIATFGISVLKGCLILGLLQAGLIHLPPKTSNPVEDFAANPLVLVLGAAITEEVLFRGIILKGFLRRYPQNQAIILSAVLFGLAHGNLGQFISALTGGLFLGWIFAKTGSLWPCLVAHGLGNGMPEAWAPALGLKLGSLADPRAWLIAMVSLIIGILLIKRHPGPYLKWSISRS